jgi:hypothetical protein
MVNLEILRGTWQARRAEISRLCDALDVAAEADTDAISKAIIRLVDEVGHLHAMLTEWDRWAQAKR